MAGLSLADLLGVLGHTDGDFTAVCTKPPGGQFSSRVLPSGQAPGAVPAAGDCWFSVNPLSDPATWPENKGRGTAAEVTRLAAVFCDLDIKSTGMPTMEAAGAVISDLSSMLGSRPSAVIFSGHGLQPFWPIEDGPSGPGARALLRRFGRLVMHVAEIHWGQADMVFDIARVLRVPNTMNLKAEPVPVFAAPDTGRPLSADELDEQLTLYGAVELPGDRDEPGQRIVSDPGSWTWADQTCHYATAMVASWSDDEPAARHPWLVRQATRIAAAHRYGCFDEWGYDGAQAALAVVFRLLLSRGPEARKEAPGEIADALAWGRDLAGSKSDAELGSELGRHSHEPPEPGLTFDATGKPPGDSFQVSAYQDRRLDDELFQRAVQDHAYKLHVRHAGQELFAAELAAAVDIPPFDAGTLGDILLRPAEPPYRAVGLIPNEASTLIVAMRKTGKTTLNLNLARSLILGEDFLGRFPVRPISGNVGLLNYEVSAAQIARWADDVGIPRDRLCIVNLRGRRNPLGNDGDKERLAQWLKDHDCESLIVDPFGRAYTGVSQNDSGEVGAWLAELDRWARSEVGAVDLTLSVHAGWEGERSRGASALEDWGDTIITLTRRKAGDDEGEADMHRYLRAEGRDVEVDEDQLEYDPVTRLLTLTGSGGRRKASENLRVDKLIPVVVEYVNSNPACSQRNLEEDLPFRKVDIRKAAEVAAVRGLIRRTSIGKGFSHMPNSELEERVRPGLLVTDSENGYRDAPKSQNVDNSDNILPLFQAENQVRPTASQVRPGRTASTASPDSIGGGRGTRAENACTNPAHTPVIRRGRWECPDCDREAGVVS